MDIKPTPPSGIVQDLRKTAPKTPEEQAKEKQARHDKVRRNLRLFALVLAGYYFASAGWSLYQEKQHENNATVITNIQNPLHNPDQFRETFNTLLNKMDTSLPTANANNTPEGFIAVLSTAIEMQGFSKPNSKELAKVQIQTRYPDAFPPESVAAFRTFVLACETLANVNATQAEADQILNSLNIVPQVDANQDNKVFPNQSYQSGTYTYTVEFTSGPIDELTLTATPLALNQPENKASSTDSQTTEDIPTLETDVPTVETTDSDVPKL